MIPILFSPFLASSQYIVASGGTVTVDGLYRIHEFTTNGNFVISNAPAGATVGAMLVGGGGGSSRGGGAGGGYYYGAAVSVASGTYAIVIGDGGTISNNGTDTTAFGKTALGGGKWGTAGGSGGGGQWGTNSGVGGAAQQPGSADSGYGYAGGNSIGTGDEGGGGGAGGAGGQPTGGVGRSADIGTGTFAAGGDGETGGVATPTSGGSNTGNGGKGTGLGGSGIVRVRYQYTA